MSEKHQKRPDEPEETRGEEETEQARREMVYLLRSILEEVHSQRQAASRPTDDDGAPRDTRLHGAALEASRLFQRIEGQIALVRPNEFEQRQREI